MDLLSPVTLESDWVPQSESIPRRDFFTEFIITVAFPLGLALILFVILSIIMFGRRTGLEKRNQLTPDMQLEQFDTIRRATTNLRYMSNRRDGPAPVSPRPNSPRPATSTPNMAPNLLTQPLDESRGQSLPPPPYRLPPNYSPDSTLPRGSEPGYMQYMGDEEMMDRMQDDMHLVDNSTLRIRGQ